jgi:hypothetical protein
MIERKIEVVVGGVKRGVSGGNEDIWSEQIEDLLPFRIFVVLGILSLFSFFPRFGLFLELGR